MVTFFGPAVEEKSKESRTKNLQKKKTTDTKWVILNSSNHAYQQKVARFDYMIHRMLTFPISPEAVVKETKHIFEVVRLNFPSAAWLAKRRGRSNGKHSPSSDGE